MTTSVDRLDRLVEGYLAAVAHATTGLPAGRREDLLADLREHIAVARADLHTPTEAGLLTILDRLGEPAAIAEEARLSEPAGPGYPAPAPIPATYPLGTQRVLWPVVLVLALALMFLAVMAVGATLVTQTA
jgi:hypothetical protein